MRENHLKHALMEKSQILKKNNIFSIDLNRLFSSLYNNRGTKMEANYRMKENLDSVVRTFYISSSDEKLVALEELTRNYTTRRYQNTKRILP